MSREPVKIGILKQTNLFQCFRPKQIGKRRGVFFIVFYALLEAFTTQPMPTATTSQSSIAQQLISARSKSHSAPFLLTSSSHIILANSNNRRSCPTLKDADGKAGKTARKIIGLSNANNKKEKFLKADLLEDGKLRQKTAQNCPFDSASTSSTGTSFFLDECPAFFDQVWKNHNTIRDWYFCNYKFLDQKVPEIFGMGLTPVRLCLLAASNNYLAMGSQSGGALFLFNRRLGKSVKPLVL